MEELSQLPRDRHWQDILVPHLTRFLTKVLNDPLSSTASPMLFVVPDSLAQPSGKAPADGAGRSDGNGPNTYGQAATVDGTSRWPILCFVGW